MIQTLDQHIDRAETKKRNKTKTPNNRRGGGRIQYENGLFDLLVTELSLITFQTHYSSVVQSTYSENNEGGNFTQLVTINTSCVKLPPSLCLARMRIQFCLLRKQTF